MSGFIKFRYLCTPKTPTCRRVPRKRNHLSTVSIVWIPKRPCRFPLPQGHGGCSSALPSTGINLNENVILARGAVKPKSQVIAWENGRRVLNRAWVKQHNYDAYLAELGPATERDDAPMKSRRLTCLLGIVKFEEVAGLSALCFPLDVDDGVPVAEEAERRGRQISGGTLSPIPRAS